MGAGTLMGGNQVALSQESEGKAVEAEPTSKLNPSIDVSPLQGLPVQLFPIPLLSFPRELFGPRRLLGLSRGRASGRLPLQVARYSKQTEGRQCTQP